jgi:hypothetical protein
MPVASTFADLSVRKYPTPYRRYKPILGAIPGKRLQRPSGVRTPYQRPLT